MSVVLFILKLIGIVLLALLGLLLLLVLLVLFVPVRYQVSGQIEDEVTVHAKVHWLLHLISFCAEYEGGESAFGLRVLGIRMKARSKSKGKSALEEEDWEDEESEPEEAREPEEPHEVPEPEKARKPEKAQKSDETVVRASGSKKVEQTECDDLSDGQTGKEKIVAKYRTFGELLKKISFLKEIITDEANKNVLLAVLAELKYLLKHFRFRKLITDLRFSAGDPAATGQALGVLSMFPVLYQYQVSIIPDFESEELYVRGAFEIQGRMRAVHFAVSLARLWKKKEVRILVKKLLDR